MTIVSTTNRAPDTLRRAALIVLLTCAVGALARSAVQSHGYDVPFGNNVFFVLYAAHELPFIAITALFALAALLLPRVGGEQPETMHGATWLDTEPSRSAVLLVALGVLLFGWLGSDLLVHHYPLSMDEFSGTFQARIFASGRLTAPVAPEFREAIHSLTPIFTGYQPGTATWASMYLPVYAGIRTVFLEIGAEWMTNAMLSAVSVLLLAAIARRLWPADGRRQWVAVLALATSSQLLITGATAYAMPAHLCINLLWLWLFLRGDRASLIALPFVGVLAMGLHNPFPHALFVAPFLLLLVFRKRWALTAYLAVVYLAGAALWLAWLRGVQPQAQQGGAGGLFTVFQLPTSFRMVVQGMNLTLIATWQAPIVALGLAAALLGFRRLTHPMRELAWGVVITFVFYFFFPYDQGHGWGYRYIEPVLGSIVLLAADAWWRVTASLRPRHARNLLVAGLLVTLVQIPVRAASVESFIRPFAHANELVQQSGADVVVLPVRDWWYGRDLVRNDPLLLARPLVVSAPDLTAPQFRALMQRLGPAHQQVQMVPYAALLPAGMRAPYPESVVPHASR